MRAVGGVRARRDALSLQSSGFPTFYAREGLGQREHVCLKSHEVCHVTAVQVDARELLAAPGGICPATAVRADLAMAGAWCCGSGRCY